MEETWEAQLRVEMSLVPPQERIRSFREIELGFSEERARREAKRCLRCDLET
jgi:NADH-quinone oxidoreductase subunit F